MSLLFRTREWLTIAQLVRAWAAELSTAGGNPTQLEQDLAHVLIEDIVNGRLDNSGPLWEGRRNGVAVITPENKAGFIEGGRLIDQFRANRAAVLDFIIVMKEAVIDFSKRRQLPAPSWWSDLPEVPDLASTAVKNIGAATQRPVTQRGKTPRIIELLEKHFPEGVPDPAYCPRKALKADLLKWDPDLDPLDEATLKKAIDSYHATKRDRKSSDSA
jgi:hypothetical protein